MDRILYHAGVNMPPLTVMGIAGALGKINLTWGRLEPSYGNTGTVSDQYQLLIKVPIESMPRLLYFFFCYSFTCSPMGTLNGAMYENKEAPVSNSTKRRDHH